MNINLHCRLLIFAMFKQAIKKSMALTIGNETICFYSVDKRVLKGFKKNTLLSKVKITTFIFTLAYMKCVVKMMVRPALCFSSKSHVPLRAYGSIPEVGSSKNTISDPPIRAMAQLRIIEV